MQSNYKLCRNFRTYKEGSFNQTLYFDRRLLVCRVIRAPFTTFPHFLSVIRALIWHLALAKFRVLLKIKWLSMFHRLTKNKNRGSSIATQIEPRQNRAYFLLPRAKVYTEKIA